MKKPAYKPSEVIGIYKVLESTSLRTGNNLIYLTRCIHCGNEVYKRADKLQYGHRGCRFHSDRPVYADTLKKYRQDIEDGAIK